MSDPVRTLQLAELDILKQVLAIIEAHELTYYLLGGTLLGAVRHQGFIPWDDDIDIGMPRPDYERFLEYASRELTAPYRLHTVDHNRSEYFYYYARVENADLMLLRKAAIKEVRIPVWVDVFPLDGVPDDGFKRQVWIRKCVFLQKLFKMSQYSYFGNSPNLKVERTLPKRILRSVFMTLHMEKLLSPQTTWEMLDRALKENHYVTCNTIVNFCGFWKLKEMFPKSVYGSGTLYPFEGLMLNGPDNYDFVLTQMYGDYMTPPPVEQRNHHHLELISE